MSYERPEGDVVRYGDAIGLRHCATEFYLASSEECYEGGSGQQKVFCVGWEEEVCLWAVLPVEGSGDEVIGNEVGFDDQFRLKHIGTGRHLHSHPDIESPITAQQEVTGFGGDEETDENDVWKLEMIPDQEEAEGEDYLWHLGRPVVIRHVATGQTLHSHPIQLTEGTHEVTAFGGFDENSTWAASFE